MPTIINSLKEYRLASNYTQEEVVNFLGLKSSNRLSQWEASKAFPSIENLFKLSALYKTTPQKLYPDLYTEQRKIIRRRTQKPHIPKPHQVAPVEEPVEEEDLMEKIMEELVTLANILTDTSE